MRLVIVLLVGIAAWGQTVAPTPTPTEQIATLKAQLATAQAQVELFRGKWLAAQAQVFARAAQDAEVSSKAACGPDLVQQQDQNGLPVCTLKPSEISEREAELGRRATSAKPDVELKKEK